MGVVVFYAVLIDPKLCACSVNQLHTTHTKEKRKMVLLRTILSIWILCTARGQYTQGSVLACWLHFNAELLSSKEISISLEIHEEQICIDPYPV